MKSERQFYTYYTSEIPFRKIKAAQATNEITEDDAALLCEFLNEYMASRNISYMRQAKIMNHIIIMRRLMEKPFRGCTAGDIYHAINQLQTVTTTRGRTYAQNTQHDLVSIFKLFLSWLLENEYIDIPEKKLKKIKSPASNMETTSPEEILTIEEVGSMIDVCYTSRDAAIIATLYESGARIGELARLQWKDVRFDENGISLYIRDTKTKRTRYMRLYIAVPYLATWRNHYPLKPAEGDAYVFLTHSKQQFIWETMDRLVKRIAIRAGVTKKIHTHLFRKSRITHMVTGKYNESIIKKVMWGHLDTDMFKTYVVLSEHDIDAEMAERAGVKIKKSKKERMMEPIICQGCGEINGPTDRFCRNCGVGLTDEVRMSVFKAEKLIEKTGIIEEIREIVRQELGIEGSDSKGSEE